MGSITGTGASVTFTAGSTAGTVTLFVNATLKGKTVQSPPVVITIQASSPPPKTGFLGLSGDLGYVVIGVIVAAIVVAAVIALFLLRKKKKEGEAVPTPPQSENYPPDTYPSAYPPPPGP
jgi:hypothetical protein